MGPPPGPRVEGVKLEPLIAAEDASKPLLSKLLAVPSLRQRYLAHVRAMTDRWLDWRRLGPIASRYHSLIAAEVAADTRKLDSTEAFTQGLTTYATGAGEFRPGPGGGGRRIGLKDFADQRRAFLKGRLDELNK